MQRDAPNVSIQVSMVGRHAAANSPDDGGSGASCHVNPRIVIACPPSFSVTFGQAANSRNAERQAANASNG